jgi:hydrogenase expression/formation protein HypE
MNESSKKFGLGKLKHEFLNTLLRDFVSDLEIKDKRVILGSSIGEDAAVIDIGERYLVAKTDPISFVSEDIGYYAVNVNVNDLVCVGARPKWFQSVILLPDKKTSSDLVERIFKDIHDTCRELHITVIGGHTEVTSGLDRPIVVGSLLGEVEKEKLVKTSGAKKDDEIILTKGIFIEGTSIIGREKSEFLKERGYEDTFIKRCKDYVFDPGISVFQDALLANDNFQISSMHDPTEGGLSCGLIETAMAANLGILIDDGMIPILNEPLELSKLFHLDPKGTITSGSLLISINKLQAQELIVFLKKNNINAQIIGKFLEPSRSYQLRLKSGKIVPLKYSEKDEILKIF